MNKKQIEIGSKVQEETLKGIKILYDSVVSTLGPSGKNVIIEDEYDNIHITKDGVTVAKSINVKDKLHNAVIQIIKKVAQDTDDKVGDGTTTATVLAYNIIKEGLRLSQLGGNSIEIKRGIDQAVDYVINSLDEMSISMENDEQIRHLALVSSNNDNKIAELLVKAITKVGRDGIIMVEDSNTMKDELDFAQGLQFDKGFLSHYFITNQQTMECELDNPYILLYDHKITTNDQLMKILQVISMKQQSLLIIANDIADQAMALLIMNKLRGNMKIAAVKAPGFGDEQKKILEDISILTNTEVFSYDKGQKLENIDNLEVLGQCGKVRITKNKTTIIDGIGDETKKLKRVEDIKSLIDNSDSNYEKEKLQKRMANILNGIAIIRIGAETEMELNEKKDRFNDALNATKSGIENGILPGGGLSLMRILHNKNKIKEYTSMTPDQKIGFDILMASISSPFDNILKNANEHPEVIWNKIKNKIDNYGYDVRNKKYGDMIEMGIIDPTKVVKTGLKKASSIASLFLTTEIFILDIPNKDKPQIHPQQMY